MTLAHGVGTLYESPLPVWLYLVGAAAAVLVSFLARSLTGREIAESRERLLLGPSGRERLVGVLRVAGLSVLGLVVLFAFIDPAPGFTVTPLLFWVVLIIATLVLSCAIAWSWEALDPWGTMHGFYRSDEAASSRRLPDWLGPVLIYGLFWFELVSGRGFDPVAILLVVAAYTLFSLAYRSANNWARVDPLSILFGFGARLAPLESRPEGVVYRGQLTGLDERTPMPSPLFASVLILLASTTFDNLRETVEWTDFLQASGLDAIDSRLLDSLALAVLTLPFFLTLLGAVAIARRWIPNEPSLMETARTYGWSLIPIGIAYVLAHNMSLLIIGVPQLINRIIDSLGWNLFEGYVPSPLLVWVLSIALVVWGHVLGVLSAHRISLRITNEHRAAVAAHTGLTALMTFYTVATLWLLSLPLVAEG